jgi:hypothetical protein
MSSSVGKKFSTVNGVTFSEMPNYDGFETIFCCDNCKKLGLSYCITVVSEILLRVNEAVLLSMFKDHALQHNSIVKQIEKKVEAFHIFEPKCVELGNSECIAEELKPRRMLRPDLIKDESS